MLLPMVSVSPSVAVALAHMVAPVIRYSESRAPSPRLCDAASCSVADLKNLLVARLADNKRLGEAATRLIDALAASDAAQIAPDQYCGEFDLSSFDALSRALEDVRLRPLSGVARLAKHRIELELDAQHCSGDNVGLTLSGTVAPLDGNRSFRVEMSDGEVFARDVGDIGEARAAQFCAIRTQCCPFTDARSSHRR